jgi:phospholipid/cholesterol/gamma-HCH transport system substrate-binding protein
MSYSRPEIALGAVVLSAAAAFLIYSASLTGFGASSAGQFILKASFRSVDGVSVGTDVRLAGVKVGAVKAIDLNPVTYRAETTLAIADGFKIPDDSAISIESEGLLGGNFVNISPGGSEFYFASGEEVEDTQSAVSLITLLLRFVGGSTK